MIANQTSAQADAFWSVHVEMSDEVSDQPALASEARPGAEIASPRRLSSDEFKRLSSQHALILEGAAGANLENVHSLIFFENMDQIESKSATMIPVDRIRSIEILSDAPVANTPLNLSSLWRVRIELAPTVGKKARLDTVFES